MLQETPLLPKNIKKSLCYDLRANTTGTLSISIVNEHGSTLGLGWVDNTTDAYCNEIIFDDDTTNQLIGVKCLDCDSDDYVTLHRAYVGERKVYVISSVDGVLSGGYQQPLAYDVKTLRDCREVIKKILDFYLVFLSGAFLIMMILVGYKGFKDMLFKGW